MENSFQTSFIPKKPITSSIADKAPKSLISIIAIFLLIVSVLGSVGLFFYKTYLNKQKESSSSALSDVRDSFEKDTIVELDSFNKKTEVAKQILNNHIILSPLFTSLGEITIPQVQYTKFEQTTNEGGFLVNIEGEARDYRSIALQADMFNTTKGRFFKNVVFSNLTKDEKSNKITFNLEFNVDPGLLSYENSNQLNQNQGNPIPPSEPLLPGQENVTQ